MCVLPGFRALDVGDVFCARHESNRVVRSWLLGRENPSVLLRQVGLSVAGHARSHVVRGCSSLVMFGLMDLWFPETSARLSPRDCPPADTLPSLPVTT